MKINNIEDIKKTIGLSNLAGIILCFIIATCALFIIDWNLKKQSTVLEEEQIHTAINIFKNELYKQLNRIANAYFFMDYLHSGAITRERTEQYFNYRISIMQPDFIKGMYITSLAENAVIYESGEISNNALTLNLCYFDDKMNSDYGLCEYEWTVYLVRPRILEYLNMINNNIQIVYNTTPSHFLEFSDNLIDFPIKENIEMPLTVSLDYGESYMFYKFALIITAILLFFAYWHQFTINRVISKYINRPIKNITQGLQQSKKIGLHQNGPEEFQYLSEQINTWRDNYAKVQEQESEIAYGKLAAQVAHDVRSPLATLRMMLAEADKIPDSQKEIFYQAVNSIHDTANRLLRHYRDKNNPKTSRPSTNIFSLLHCIEQIISEKQLVHKSINFSVTSDAKNEPYNARVNEQDFKHIVTNILNNAIEATDDQGKIAIHLSIDNATIHITIKDNGCGMSQETLQQIFQAGFSYNKANGNGLGLAMAQCALRAWQGEITATSALGHGSLFSLTLPHAKISLCLPSKINMQHFNQIAICDDEASLLSIWQLRLNKNEFLKQHNIKWQTFTNPHDFIRWYNHHGTVKTLCLIDQEFKNSDMSGIEAIDSLDIHLQSILITSYFDDDTIRQYCRATGVKLMSKETALNAAFE